MHTPAVLKSYRGVLHERFVHVFLPRLVGNSQTEIISANWIKTSCNICNYQCTSALGLISLMTQFMSAGTNGANVQNHRTTGLLIFKVAVYETANL